MKYIYYFLKYAIIMIIGDLIKIIHIPSIYTLPFLVLIPYNFLAIEYGIKYPLEKRKDISKKELLIPILILSSLLIIIMMKLNNIPNTNIIIILIANFIELYLIKPKHESQKEIIENNIKDYFEQNKKDLK